jgi:hypothetical protein
MRLEDTMRASRALLLVVILIAVSTLASAQGNEQPAPQSPSPNSVGLTTLQPRKPVTPPPFVFRIATPTVRPNVNANTPTIVCGMTLLPADPTFDAAIRKNVPQAPNTRLPITAVQPSICTRTAP